MSTTAGSERPRSVARPRQALTPAPGGSHTSSRRPSVCSPFSVREVACKLDSYQADRSLNHPPLSRTLPARVGTQQPRGPEYPAGRRLWRPRTLRPVRPGCPGGCSRSNSRLTGTPSPVGAGGFRSSSRHPAGRHTPPWKLVLEGVQAMSSGSHPWTSQTLATGLLPFLPGWALRRVWPGRSVAAEVVPRGHVHVCV